MSQDLELQKSCVESFGRIREQLHKEIVGMDRVIDALFWTILCQGHALFVGVPGLAKTLLISSLSKLVGLEFNRIQFTPDMMPSDLLGSEVLEEDKATGKRQFEFRKGPIFCQLLLADEVNRTPPKTQSALLQAMQESKVSIAGRNFNLEKPFCVFATQNPIESEGTYPLPEAQLDRFLFSIPVEYPSEKEEVEIVRQTTSGNSVSLEAQISADQLLEFQALVRRMPLEDQMLEKLVRMVRASRPNEQMDRALSEQIRFGAGPRASQAISLGAKARALLDGRYSVREEDLIAVAPFVLRHRLVLRSFRQVDDQLMNQIISAGA